VFDWRLAETQQRVFGKIGWVAKKKKPLKIAAMRSA
jgi:hypothetical protein